MFFNEMLVQEIQACGRRVVAVGECGLDYWKNYDEPLNCSWHSVL